MKVINIKEYMPDSEYATFMLETAIRDNIVMGEKVLIVVHGYGSHGVGGTIKSSTMQLLAKMRKEAKIIDFVNGENWGDTNEVKIEMCRRYPDLIINPQLYGLNSGITVVWLVK